MRERFISILTVLSKPAVAIGGALVIGASIIGLAWYATTASSSGSSVSVNVGPITEEVDVSGIVKAAHSTDLAFQTSGRVASIRAQVGDHVNAWQTLIVLDNSSQLAAVALAKANLEAQQAKLEGLKSGARPEDVALYKQKYADASSALIIAMNNAYLETENAVLRYADTLFTNGATANPTLKVTTQSWDEGQSVEMDRIIVGEKLVKWKTILGNLNASSDDKALRDARSVGRDAIVFISGFLSHLGTIVGNLSPSGSGMPQADIDTDRLNINTAAQTVSSGASAEQSAYAAWTAASDTLISQESGSKPEDIHAQKAAVDAAQASLDASQAMASQAVISAPVSGIVTAQNANLGETVVPGVPLVSMIADGKYQVDAQISETDITKVKVNDTVEATFAAYPGAVFSATVTTVDPAATMNGGVAAFGITITFLNNDSRLLPGLSANLRVITATKDSVLLVPTSAIITDKSVRFVYVKNTKGILQMPVTVGIESASGMTEIVSGLVKGDNVLTFGARSAQ